MRGSPNVDVAHTPRGVALVGGVVLDQGVQGFESRFHNPIPVRTLKEKLESVVGRIVSGGAEARHLIIPVSWNFSKARLGEAVK